MASAKFGSFVALWTMTGSVLTFYSGALGSRVTSFCRFCFEVPWRDGLLIDLKEEVERIAGLFDAAYLGSGE